MDGDPLPARDVSHYFLAANRIAAARPEHEHVIGAADLDLLFAPSECTLDRCGDCAVGRFLAQHLGPIDPDQGEQIARAVPAARLPQREHPFSAIEPEKSGLQNFVQAIRAAGNNRRDGAEAAETLDGESVAATEGANP